MPKLPKNNYKTYTINWQETHQTKVIATNEQEAKTEALKKNPEDTIMNMTEPTITTED